MKIKNNYFSHDFNARHDRKILKLRMNHGAEGYGIYWMLIEVLCTQPDFKFPLSDLEALAYEFNCDVSLIKTIIDDYELFVKTNDCFYSPSLCLRMNKIVEKSNVAKRNALKRWSGVEKSQENETFDAMAMQLQCDGNATAMQPQCDGNATAMLLNEIKLNEIKLNENITPPISPPTSGGEVNEPSSSGDSGITNFDMFWLNLMGEKYLDVWHRYIESVSANGGKIHRYNASHHVRAFRDCLAKGIEPEVVLERYLQSNHKGIYYISRDLIKEIEEQENGTNSKQTGSVSSRLSYKPNQERYAERIAELQQLVSKHGGDKRT